MQFRLAQPFDEETAFRAGLHLEIGDGLDQVRQAREAIVADREARHRRRALAHLGQGRIAFFVALGRLERRTQHLQQLGIDRTVMTYLLDDLERADLVVRRPAPTDRRTRHVIATDNGRDRLADLDRRLAHAETHVLAGLPKADQDSFKDLLCRLAAHVNELDPVDNACTVVEDIAATRP